MIVAWPSVPQISIVTGFETSSHPAARVPIGAVVKQEDAFAEFVAVGIARRAVGDRGGDAIDRLVHQPQEQVERVGAQIAIAAHARLGRVGHPAPFAVEPAAERAVVNVERWGLS